MSREGDGMGDVIRKAAVPAGEGSYKKVRDKKGPFVCPQSPSRQEGDPPNRCPRPSRGAGFGVPEQGSARRCLMHRHGAANLPPSAFPYHFMIKKTRRDVSKRVLIPRDPWVLRQFAMWLEIRKFDLGLHLLANLP